MARTEAAGPRVEDDKVQRDQDGVRKSLGTQDKKATEHEDRLGGSLPAGI